jgi:hypothetical protein
MISVKNHVAKLLGTPVTAGSMTHKTHMTGEDFFRGQHQREIRYQVRNIPKKKLVFV